MVHQQALLASLITPVLPSTRRSLMVRVASPVRLDAVVHRFHQIGFHGNRIGGVVFTKPGWWR